jgi:hypothetical protein
MNKIHFILKVQNQGIIKTQLQHHFLIKKIIFFKNYFIILKTKLIIQALIKLLKLKIDQSKNIL